MTQQSPPPLTHAEAIELAPMYVLDALEPADAAAVREHLTTCPESHAEFEQLGGVVPYLLDDPSLELVEPPRDLRDRVMAAAAADVPDRAANEPTSAERTAAEPVTPVAFPSAAERHARAGRTRTRPRALTWVAAIAAVLAIAILGAWNVALQAQVNDLHDDVAAAEQYRTAVASVLDVAAQPGSQIALLAPTESGGPRGIAAVAPDGSIQFAMEDLAPTTGSQVYETWAIASDGAPVPLGSFTVDESGTVAFTSKQGPADAGVTVAVSREPQAGAIVPTDVVSAGEATAPAG
ncbi:MAG: anti-sigma factor domain-containing protein [Chloroflexota bacterium]